MINEKFITLIRIAEDDESTRTTLLSLLRLSPLQRIEAIEKLLVQLRSKGAPIELIEAITPLCENQIAQKALELLDTTSK